MATPFVSEIRITSFNFPPKGWALCNGQLMSIQQNTALFSLVGTTYGGDGIRTFGLPNLQGCVPVHQGPGYALGQAGGEAAHTLLANEIPSHSHTYTVTSDAATVASPAGARPATASAVVGNVYGAGPATTGFAPGAVAFNTPSGQPHNNMQPYLTLNFIIALTGIFPSRN